MNGARGLRQIVQVDNLLPPLQLATLPGERLLVPHRHALRAMRASPTRPRHAPEPQGLCYDKMSCGGLIMLREQPLRQI